MPLRADGGDGDDVGSRTCCPSSMTTFPVETDAAWVGLPAAVTTMAEDRKSAILRMPGYRYRVVKRVYRDHGLISGLIAQCPKDIHHGGNAVGRDAHCSGTAGDSHAIANLLAEFCDGLAQRAVPHEPDPAGQVIWERGLVGRCNDRRRADAAKFPKISRGLCY